MWFNSNLSLDLRLTLSKIHQASKKTILDFESNFILSLQDDVRRNPRLILPSKTIISGIVITV